MTRPEPRHERQFGDPPVARHVGEPCQVRRPAGSAIIRELARYRRASDRGSPVFEKCEQAPLLLNQSVKPRLLSVQEVGDATLLVERWNRRDG